jgi:hypothetical protein
MIGAARQLAELQASGAGRHMPAPNEASPTPDVPVAAIQDTPEGDSEYRNVT